MATAYTPAPAISNIFAVGANYLLTAGSYVDMTGTLLVGFTTFGTPIGDISPLTLNGRTIRTFITASRVSPYVAPYVQIDIISATGQNFFTSVTANGITLLTANADLYIPGGVWLWTTGAPNMFPADGIYPVEFT